MLEWHAQQGRSVAVRNGMLFLDAKDPDAGFGSLDALAAGCASVEPDQWPALFEQHFGSITRALERADEVPPFDSVAEQLRVRLLAAPAFEPPGGGAVDPAQLPVHRNDLDGIVTTLVVDHSESVMSVAPAWLDAWGKDQDELFRLALRNVANESDWSCPDTETREWGRIFLLVGESFFVASRALVLDHHPELVGPHGALVAVPNRHSMLAFPIVGAGVESALESMVPLAIRGVQGGPGAISGDIYWWDRQRFWRITVEIEGRTVRVSPPPAFSDLCARLAAE